LSVVISYTPVGKQIDRLAEAFVNRWSSRSRTWDGAPMGNTSEWI